MIKDGEIKIEESDEEFKPQNHKDDPFLRTGYGVNAYFDIQYSVIKLFIMITIMLLPVVYLYKDVGYNKNKSIVL